MLYFDFLPNQYLIEILSWMFTPIENIYKIVYF